LRRGPGDDEDAPMRRRVTALAAGVAALAATLAAAAPGDLSLVSVSSSGTPGNQPVEASAVSADGRFVAFTSQAQLTGTPTAPGIVQLYVRDRVARTTVLASSSAAGVAADSGVDAESVGNAQFAISGNGRYAVFASGATNLTARADTGKAVFRKDLQTGAVALASVNSAGQQANTAVGGDPDVSYDGGRVAFTSGAATNLVEPDVNGVSSDVVVRDLAAGTTTLVAVNAAGAQANGITERPAISADGRVVAFEAPTGTFNLIPGDADGGGNDIVVRNLAAGTTAGASDPTAAAGSGFPDISGDGRYVVFETDQPYDAANDAAGKDVYRRDMATGAVALASAVNGGTLRGNDASERPAIDAIGERVAFLSAATDLVGADANATLDVYARDVAPHVTRRASARADGIQPTNDSDRAAVAGNGAAVTFVNSDAGVMSAFVPGDVNAQPDVFAKELAPTDATPPALAVSGATWTATDPSGIGEVTINGAPVTLAGDGTFAVPAALGAVVVQAVDGAGNGTSLTRPALPVTTPPTRPRVQRLRASLKGRRVTVRFLLSADARVTVTLLRRTVRKKPKRRVVLTRVRRPLTKALKAGQRSVVLTLGRRPAPGRYTVRVRANAAGLVSTATTGLVVKPLRPKRRSLS
jgi:Tol biopolymer transport system component